MFERMGLEQTPWAVRVYLFLVLLFSLLLLVAAVPGLSHLRELVSEAMQTVLSALLGALSATATERGS